MARSALVPILSGYGRVDIVLDETFQSAQSVGVFGGEFTNLIELCTVHRFQNAEWEDRVDEIIQKTDIAIVDSTKVTCGVMWELAQYYKYLPPYRVYLVIDAVALKYQSLKDYMKEFYRTLSTHPEMPRNVRPYVFVLGSGAWQQETLANDIHRKMCEVVATERGDLYTERHFSV